MRGRRLPALLAVLLVAGCTAGVRDLPLPGGADLGERPYRVTLRFADVADLVPQAAVRVGDVPVGRVEEISLAADNRTVHVAVSVRGSVVLPANATGRLRQSSLLGEKFVELAAPRDPAAARLADGDVIGLERTTRGTEVEEVLGAISLLLNGGGLQQVRTITTELNAALSGNTGHIRSLLANIERLVSTLDDQRGDIARALEGVDRLAGTLAAQRDTIAGALDDLTPGLRVLTEQRDQLVGMLRAVDRLAEVAVDTIGRSQADLIADLEALAPTLDKLAEAGTALPRALELLLTFPLPDEGLDIVRGDYANARIKADLRLDKLIANLESAQPVVPLPGNSPTPDPGGGMPAPAPPLPLPRAGQAPAPQEARPTEPDLLGGLLGTLLGGR
ncbi:MCE family protein [Amycolatopsis aidingensis]|uniref:MCE family protein n=1 Tax=Amycolatopsis aidingensis TaxID=2842453 RepID=UPI001C0AC5F5|nr:MCE family protein [Amycolatopsis aidingensis]